MKVIYKACGDYRTNCYIIFHDDFEIIIDPGVGAFEWIKENVKNPKAILNTHGHYDHTWSNTQVKEFYDIPLYIQEADSFLIENDYHKNNLPPSFADYKVKPDEVVKIGDLDIKFWHFPGHTPGCSAIEIDDVLFSGDFLFHRSIGITNLPYSNPEDMKKSLERIGQFTKNYTIYPGHGPSTTLEDEKPHLGSWIKYL